MADNDRYLDLSFLGRDIRNQLVHSRDILAQAQALQSILGQINDVAVQGKVQEVVKNLLGVFDNIQANVNSTTVSGNMTITSTTGFTGPGGFQGASGSGGVTGFAGPGGFQGVAGSGGVTGFAAPGGFQSVGGSGGVTGYAGPGGTQSRSGTSVEPVANSETRKDVDA